MEDVAGRSESLDEVQVQKDELLSKGLDVDGEDGVCNEDKDDDNKIEVLGSRGYGVCDKNGKVGKVEGNCEGEDGFVDVEEGEICEEVISGGECEAQARDMDGEEGKLQDHQANNNEVVRDGDANIEEVLEKDEDMDIDVKNDGYVDAIDKNGEALPLGNKKEAQEFDGKKEEGKDKDVVGKVQEDEDVEEKNDEVRDVLDKNQGASSIDDKKDTARSDEEMAQDIRSENDEVQALFDKENKNASSVVDKNDRARSDDAENDNVAQDVERESDEARAVVDANEEASCIDDKYDRDRSDGNDKNDDMGQDVENKNRALQDLGDKIVEAQDVEANNIKAHDDGVNNSKAQGDCNKAYDVVNNIEEVHDVEDKKKLHDSEGQKSEVKDVANEAANLEVLVSGETQVVNSEDDTMVAIKDVPAGQLVNDSMEIDSGETQVLDAEEVAATVIDNSKVEKAAEQIMEMDRETWVPDLEEVAAPEVDDCKAEKDTKRNMEMDQEQNSEGNGVLDEEATEVPSGQTNVLGEEAGEIMNEQDLQSKTDNSVSCAEKEQDFALNSGTEEQARVTCEGTDVEEGKNIGEVNTSSAEEGNSAEIDTVARSFPAEETEQDTAVISYPDEETNAAEAVKDVEEGIDKKDIIISSSYISETVGVDAIEIVGKELMDRENDKEIDLAAKQETEINQKDTVKEDTNTVNGDSLSVDMANSSQAAQEAYKGEVEATSYNVLLDPNFDISNYIDFDGIVTCPTNVQHVKAETLGSATEIGIQGTNKEEVTMSNEQEGHKPNLELQEVSPANVLSTVDPNTADETVTRPEDFKHEVVAGSADISIHHVHEVDATVGHDIEHENQVDETCQQDMSCSEEIEDKDASTGCSGKIVQSKYQLPLEDEGEFMVSDLVWGKVRSHPWWPGQIFNPSDASETATKYQKHDSFLVAYFGDGTFAWNEASVLKPFRSHFSQIEKQSSSEGFKNAVDCALEEVSRRVELGLACSCIPQDAYDKIRHQIVENSGIRHESSLIQGFDESAKANYFEPEKLVTYMKSLAKSPSDGADRLELVVAKSQLMAFYRSKGYNQLPELPQMDVKASQAEEDMLYDKDHTFAQETETSTKSYNKRKHNLKGSSYSYKKQRMGDTWDSPDVDSFNDQSSLSGRKTVKLAKVSVTTAQLPPKPSFKIGECIRRAASQMTVSPSILKGNGEADGSDFSFENSGEFPGVNELLAKLYMAAQFPLKGYTFPNIVVTFFSDFKNSIVQDLYRGADKAGGKRKRVSGSPEAFEFEDMSDTYWTDRVIQNGGEEQQPTEAKLGYQFVPVELKPIAKARRPYARRRYSDANHDLASQTPPGYVDENSPAELIMHFSETDTLPSETILNKMFRHFGPIREFQTELDMETSRARVVFKKCSDAKVACNSAGKFSIFGPKIVNYQLSYIISEPFQSLPIAIEEDAI